MIAADFPHICLSEARVQAFAAPLVDYPDAFRGGPVLEDAAHAIFRHERAGRPADSFRPGEAYDERLTGDYVYAGPVYDHFGHFLAEMVHRIVPAQLLGLPGRTLFVTTQANASHGSFEALPAYIRDVLAFCGLSRDDVVIVDRNVVIERLHLVRQGASLGTYPKPGYLDALRGYTGERLDRLYAGVERPRRLYVSRSGLTKVGSFLGEAYIEARLERAGFHVFRPERHGVTEQMDHYRKAEKIVFPGGSACHGTELLGTGMLDTVLLVPRVAYQSFLFQRVLKPRAAAFSQAELAVPIGTLLRNRATDTDSEHQGVSVFDLGRLGALSDVLGFDLGKAVSVTGYARAAAADLTAYFAEVTRETPDRNATPKAALLARLGREMLRMGLRRRKAPVPAAARPAGRRVLTDREIAEIWTASETLAPPFGPFFRIALLTLQPQPLLAGLLWPELAPDFGRWDIPAARTGTGTARRVHLAEPARALLAAMPRQPGLDRVFHAKGKPMKGLAGAKHTLDAEIAMARREHAEAAGREPEAFLPWSLLDLRRTGLLRLQELGHDLAVVRSAFALDTGRPSAGSETERARALDAWALQVTGALRGSADAAPAFLDPQPG